MTRARIPDRFTRSGRPCRGNAEMAPDAAMHLARGGGDDPASCACRDAYVRNATAVVAWEALWGLGVPSCLLATVVPAYLFALGASKLLVQSITVGMGLAAVLQFLSVRLISGPKRKIRIFLTWVAFCGCWLFYGLAASWAGDAPSPAHKIVVFTLVCAGLAVTMHLGSPPYGELVVENIPLHRRGRLGSLRLLALGGCGFLGVCLTNGLMRQWSEPANFEHAMAVGAAIMLLSCLTILAIRDTAEMLRQPDRHVPGVIASLKALNGNLNFRFFLVFYALLVCAHALAPLFIGYAADVLDLPSHSVSYFTAAYFGGAVLVAVLFSHLADRHGFRLVALLSCLVMVLAFLLPLLAGRSPVALFTAYVLFAGSLSLNGIILPNIGAEMAPDVKPAVIMAAGSFFVTPLGLIVAPLAGWLVDVHARAGYLAVFVMGATLSFCAAIGYVVVVREPRSGQEIHIRIRRV